jgi:EAL and modified HD-GYP domain-containing signal transduction protein
MEEDGGAVLKLLRLLADDAEVDEIARTFRDSPALTCKLLVLVNSVAIATRQPIASVRHAVAMLGRTHLRRWLQLMLFMRGDARVHDDPLLEAVALRAGLVEHLAKAHPALAGARDAGEQGYMTGVLSLLDAVYDISMEDLATRLHLSAGVTGALTRREGPLGELLAIAERLERIELSALSRDLARLGIDEQKVRDAQRRALSWRAVRHGGA